MIDQIKTIVNSFEEISLGEIEKVAALLDRIDLKFTINISELPEILEFVKPYYSALCIKDKRIMQYKSLYFDTADFNLYKIHHNGKLNRYKVRIREYSDTNTVFFETKFKNNKGRTLKKRFVKHNKFKLEEKESEFVREMTNIDPASLKAGIYVYYKRATLVNSKSGERVTIDIDLTFKNEIKEEKFPNVAIIEVKSSKGNKNSPLLEVLKKKKIEQFGMSKYCLGVSSLIDDVKRNNFKEKLLTLNKLNFK
jgi:hypothetical protein